MEFKQLEAFVAVVDYGSFSEAARKLYLTQPTISAHISSLEKELNARLFVRNTKEVKLVSVYRDTYVNIKGHGLDKITHAYSYGGAQNTLKSLNEALDLNITEYVTVNFDAVIAAVNALNGVEIDITSEELKYINDYIDATSQSSGIKSSHLSKAGRQTVDGVQAVAYSRIRYTAGGDYKRTERMRTVVMKAFEKAKTLNVKQLDELTDILLPKVYTNIESKEILSMIPEMINYKVKENIGWPYKTRGATIGGIWYGPAITLESNVVKLHQEIYGQEDYTASKTVKQISKFEAIALENDYDVIDLVPRYIEEKYNLMNKKSAIKNIHVPEDILLLKKARQRIKYEELFMYVLKINYLKNKINNDNLAIERNIDKDKLDKFIKSLPFELTLDQDKAVNDIINDLSIKKRMNRLLQGDVGSGKTIIALIAVYANYLSKYQSALMAPTEILAVQHYEEAKKIFSKYKLNIALLTSSTSNKDKKTIYEELENGKIDLIIGTQALIQENVKYKKLGLVITDEQHR